MTQAQRRPSTAADDHERYRWTAMGVVLIGTFMAILDTTIVNVALPDIGVALHNRSDIEWIITAYLLAVGIGLPATGWLADRFGRKRIFIWSLALFTAGSLLSGLAPTLQLLIVFRVLQGLGGGAIMPVGMAMIYELFPPDQRGKALGIWGIAAMAGPAFGPVIGGYLVTVVNWHWLFFVNVPVGIIGVTLAIRLLRDTGYREVRPFDGPGLLLAAAGLCAWLLAFSEAATWGWGSAGIVALLVGGGLVLVAFARRQLRIEVPLVELRMFKVGVFTLTIVIGWAVVVAQFGRLVFLPLQLESLRGLSALEVGLLFTPGALGGALGFATGGRISDKIGPRVPAIVGGIAVAASAWILAHLHTDSSLTTIIVALVIQGIGTGLSTMPLAVSGMNALPGRYVAEASATRNLCRRAAAAFGIAVLSTVVIAQLGGISATGLPASAHGRALHAYNEVFLIGFFCALVAIALSLFLPNREANRQMQLAREAEQNVPMAEAKVAVDAEADLG